MKMATSDLASVGKAELAGCEIYLFIPPHPFPPNNPEAEQNHTANFKGFALILSAPHLRFLCPQPRCGAKAVPEGGPGVRGDATPITVAHAGQRLLGERAGIGQNRAEIGQNQAGSAALRTPSASKNGAAERADAAADTALPRRDYPLFSFFIFSFFFFFSIIIICFCVMPQIYSCTCK